MVTLPDPDVCRRCGGPSTVLQTRRGKGYKWRRHRCEVCGLRWSSYQTVLNPRKLSIKIDGA